MTDNSSLGDQFVAMAKAILRVRELHVPCSCEEACVTYPTCKECALNYPCDTIKALDGEIGSVEPVKLEALDGEQ